jgi:hypothetical protein
MFLEFPELLFAPPDWLSNLKPFVKTNKNDATDAEAVCEALIIPSEHYLLPGQIVCAGL